MGKRPRVIAGRYELIEVHGSGGMGVVWKGRDRRLDRVVAVKIPTEPAPDGSFVERFQREARSAASLHHPNIVTVHDSGIDKGSPFIVMEFVDAPSLDQILATSGSLSAHATMSLGRQVLAALSYAHAAGIVHRDIKPANIIFGSDHAKVADFGIAKREMDPSMTTTGAVVGTPSYLAPEQFRGPATPSSDLYATGCLLYACVTGKPPFHSANPFEVARMHSSAEPPAITRTDVPPALSAVIGRALQKDPADRFASADEMAAALGTDVTPAAPTKHIRALASDPTVRIDQHTQPAPPSRTGRRRTIAVIAIVALGITAGIGLASRDSKDPSATSPRSPSPSPSPSPSVGGIGDPLPARSGATATVLAMRERFAGLVSVGSPNRGVFHAAQVRICAGSEETMANPYWFQLRLANGERIPADIRTQFSPNLIISTLPPRGCAGGWVVFDAPSGSRPSEVLLVYSATRDIDIARPPHATWRIT